MSANFEGFRIVGPYADKEKVVVDFSDDPGLTKQSMADECDINKIMARYQKTGAISHFNTRSAEYGFATSYTLHEALNLVEQARTLFSELPSSLRKKFDNDPGVFLDFVQDPENEQEMVELGLREGRPGEAGLESEVTVPAGAGTDVLSEQGSEPEASEAQSST